MKKEWFKINGNFLAEARNIKAELEKISTQLGLTAEQQEEFITLKTDDNNIIYHAIMLYQEQWVIKELLEYKFPGIWELFFTESGEEIDHQIWNTHSLVFPILIPVSEEEAFKQTLEDELDCFIDHNFEDYFEAKVDPDGLRDLDDDVDISINFNKQIEVDLSGCYDTINDNIYMSYRPESFTKAIINHLEKEGYKISKVEKEDSSNEE